MSNENDPTGDKTEPEGPVTPRHLPPTGGQVMGALVSALRLREHDPSKSPTHAGELSSDLSHTANYFRGASAAGGDRIEDEYRRRVSAAIADALLAGGLIPHWPHAPEFSEVPHKDVVADALTHISGFTDAVRGMFVAQPVWLAQSDPIITWRPVIRLAAVELGVRAGAIFSMAGLERPLPATQFWATREGAGWLLRRWTSERGFAHMSHGTLLRLMAKAGGPDDGLETSTVSRWRSGHTRPSVRYARTLSKALAERAGKSPDDLFRRLEWFDGLHEIAKGIATEMGAQGDADMAWKVVEDAAALAVRVVRNTMEFLEQAPVTSAQREVLAAVSLGRGTDQHAPYLMQLAKFLVDAEHNDVDAAYIRCAFGDLEQLFNRLGAIAQDLDWHQAKLGEMFKLSPDKARSLLRRAVAHHQDELLCGRGPILRRSGSLPGETGPINIEGANCAMLAGSARALGNFAAALPLAQRAAELNPSDPVAHGHLGALLGEMHRVDDALVALRKSIELRPDWDRPRGEIGVILFNHGRYADAAAEMRHHLAELGRPEPWLLSILGAALNKQGHWAEACVVLDQSITLRPKDAITLCEAAFANFGAGNRENGRALAKLAADLGRREALDAWDAGVFGGRRK